MLLMHINSSPGLLSFKSHCEYYFKNQDLRREKFESNTDHWFQVGFWPRLESCVLGRSKTLWGRGLHKQWLHTPEGDSGLCGWTKGRMRGLFSSCNSKDKEHSNGVLQSDKSHDFAAIKKCEVLADWYIAPWVQSTFTDSIAWDPPKWAGSLSRRLKLKIKRKALLYGPWKHCLCSKTKPPNHHHTTVCVSQLLCLCGKLLLRCVPCLSHPHWHTSYGTALCW